MKTSIIAVGKMKDKAQLGLYADYAARLSPAPTLTELTHAVGSPDEIKMREGAQIEKLLNSDAFLIVLDERGKNITSMELSKSMQAAMNNGKSALQIVIGGAEGLTDAVRTRADLLLSFGKLTWPHMLARVMVLEQIYRAHQILAGHPYHREG